jgi:homeobox-leucine zipper protein
VLSCLSLSIYIYIQVAEILKDRPLWLRDCRSMEVLNVLPAGNNGTIELLYMQVQI